MKEFTERDIFHNSKRFDIYLNTHVVSFIATIIKHDIDHYKKLFSQTGKRTDLTKLLGKKDRILYKRDNQVYHIWKYPIGEVIMYIVQEKKRISYEMVYYGDEREFERSPKIKNIVQKLFQKLKQMREEWQTQETHTP